MKTLNSIAPFAAAFLLSLASLALNAQPVTVFRPGEGGYEAFRAPAVVRTGDGTLVAFAEAHKDGSIDNGDVDIVLKRSEDGGVSWTALAQLWSDADNSCCSPAPVFDAQRGRLLLVATWNKGTDNEDRIRENASEDTRRVYVLHSDDGGRSWSEAREISGQVRQDDWTWYTTGPGHAIQLASGEHAGRIVVPCSHTRYVDGIVLGHSHLIYSDNGGRDWHIGGVAQSGSECAVAELRDGSLIVNMREFKFHKNSSIKNLRQVAFSVDGGETLGGAFSDEGLPEPVCQGAMVGYPLKSKKKSGLLFCNPASKTGRKDFTVKYSEDAGRSWKAIYHSPFAMAGYSDMAVLANGSVAVLYEAGNDSPCESVVVDIIPASSVK